VEVRKEWLPGSLRLTAAPSRSQFVSRRISDDWPGVASSTQEVKFDLEHIAASAAG
jgi:hypothetical protein